jgi:hypothetical protein
MNRNAAVYWQQLKIETQVMRSRAKYGFVSVMP